MAELLKRGQRKTNESAPGGEVRRDAWHFDIRDYIVYLAFLAILIFFAIALRDTGFVSLNNFMSIIRQTTPITIMAVGMVLVLSTGEIDLSIGSVVALSALILARTLRATDDIAISVLATLSVGVLVGLFNGLTTVIFRIPSFLVTLGTLSIAQGLARNTTTLDAIPVTNETFNFWFGSGSFGPVSILFVWSAAIVFIGHLVYRNTTFGRRILATGGNQWAAASVGIRTARVKASVLVVSAVMASIAGMLYAGRLHGARYTLGETDLLTVIAAVVIGGTSLFGGRGSVMGALVGSIIMGMLNNGLVIMGLRVAEQ
ncbi:MAG TPA: ABC transporter permease, partial [Acidimicrobiia bacterium]|nr:ABC transporter permease [Acidimicrobiia bacterium]